MKQGYKALLKALRVGATTWLGGRRTIEKETYLRAGELVLSTRGRLIGLCPPYLREEVGLYFGG
ncbi:hypothetical protein SY88_13915 [Clostridiales bacterium PH28_bin88]|nr:hypothetical protein SY88_13915 [Clostridiales bacterium PH28_bin88]